MIGFDGGGPWPPNRWFNGLVAKARRNVLTSVGPGIERSIAGLARPGIERIWAKISGSGPGYGFAEATPDAAGTFDLVPGGRTDDSGRQPAYELNAVTGLAGTYERLRFSAVGDWRFQERTTGGGGGGALPVCFDCVTECFPTSSSWPGTLDLAYANLGAATYVICVYGVPTTGYAFYPGVSGSATMSLTIVEVGMDDPPTYVPCYYPRWDSPVIAVPGAPGTLSSCDPVATTYARFSFSCGNTSLSYYSDPEGEDLIVSYVSGAGPLFPVLTCDPFSYSYAFGLVTELITQS
jgi:hypothetical protein